MEPLELIGVMAASLRAGKAGPAKKAWAEAVHEAVLGFSFVLANEAPIREQLRIAAGEAAGEPVVEPVGGLIVP